MFNADNTLQKSLCFYITRINNIQMRYNSITFNCDVRTPKAVKSEMRSFSLSKTPDMDLSDWAVGCSHISLCSSMRDIETPMMVGMDTWDVGVALELLEDYHPFYKAIMDGSLRKLAEKMQYVFSKGNENLVMFL